jgi:hypothetical protein
MNGSNEVPCVFQVPLQYNDGRPVPPETMILIFKVLDRQFGGYTPPLGSIRGGSWHGQVESSERMEVWVTRDRIPILEAVVKAIGKALGQHEMFLIVPDATVHRYNIDDTDAGNLADFQQ